MVSRTRSMVLQVYVVTLFLQIALDDTQAPSKFSLCDYVANAMRKHVLSPER